MYSPQMIGLFVAALDAYSYLTYSVNGSTMKPLQFLIGLYMPVFGYNYWFFYIPLANAFKLKRMKLLK